MAYNPVTFDADENITIHAYDPWSVEYGSASKTVCGEDLPGDHHVVSDYSEQPWCNVCADSFSDSEV